MDDIVNPATSLSSESSESSGSPTGTEPEFELLDDLMIGIGIFLSTGRFTKLKGAYVAEAFSKHAGLLDKLKGFGGDVWQFRGYYRWRMGGRENVRKLAEVIWPYATDWQRGQWQPFVPGQEDARRRIPLGDVAPSTNDGEEG